MSPTFPTDENEPQDAKQANSPEQTPEDPMVISDSEESSTDTSQPVYAAPTPPPPPGYVPPTYYAPQGDQPQGQPPYPGQHPYPAQHPYPTQPGQHPAYPQQPYPQHPGQAYPQQPYPGHYPYAQPVYERYLEPKGPLKGNLPLTILAWLGILGVAAFIFVSIAVMQLSGDTGEATETTRSELMQVNLQGKMLIGQQALFSDIEGFEDQVEAGREQARMSLEQQIMGPPETRYCCAILMSEFGDSEYALDLLDDVDDLIDELDYKETKSQKKLRDLVGTLLERYDAEDFDISDISDEEREFLKSELGWSGRLALLPKAGEDTTARAALEKEASNGLLFLIIAGGVMLLAMLAGAVLSIVFFAMAASGSLTPQFLSRSNRGRIYAETFAIWLVGFFGAQIGMEYLLLAFKGAVDEVTGVYLTPVIFFGSLIVLVWPILRGISFAQLRTDIGWRLKNPFVETFFGAVAYMATMPFVLISFVLVFIIMIAMSAASASGDTNELSSVGGAGHPIQEQLAAGDTVLFFGVFVTACIAAPIVEETMFRGVLYRHLRDATWPWARVSSTIFSALFNGLIFASIHPQGLIGIPILTTLAFSFSLVREWRDSLIAPIVMHAINNGLVTCLLFLIL